MPAAVLNWSRANVSWIPPICWQVLTGAIGAHVCKITWKQAQLGILSPQRFIPCSDFAHSTSVSLLGLGVQKWFWLFYNWIFLILLQFFFLYQRALYLVFPYFFCFTLGHLVSHYGSTFPSVFLVWFIQWLLMVAGQCWTAQLTTLKANNWAKAMVDPFSQLQHRNS